MISANGWLQIALYLAALLLLVMPLGWYMARVYAGQNVGLNRLLGPAERLIYRLCGVDPDAGQGWRQYAAAALLFNALGLLAVYGLLRLQAWLPLNPQGLAALDPDLAFNTAVSFASNTNWQSYGGETTLSYLSQMLGLSVQNFLSAASGMAVLVALIRGLRGRSAATIGNFWVDLTRSTLYILLPLALILSLALVSQGVVQNFSPSQPARLLQATADAGGAPVTEQLLPGGPAASQIAIKQLGTNGGGFFNANSAHPYENPTPLANFLELLAILLIPAALTYTFGVMVGDTRQGWALLAAMLLVFVPLLLATTLSEQAGTPLLAGYGADLAPSDLQAGGNMVDKETRFGIVNSALWAAATTAASNGSVNSMHDSFTPLGGLGPLFLIQLGEVIFGGVGSGLYGMLVFAIIAVFVAGLMVGRTPEYLGKKIEAFEMKMAAIVILAPPTAVLTFTGLALALGLGGFQDAGPHGFSELLYAYSSQGNNNGSAFAGFGFDQPWHNTFGGLAMLMGRYWVIVPTLAIAGALAGKKIVPAGPGTLPTSSPLFVALLVGVVIIVGALTFLPALALGPIVEQLMMAGGV